MQTSRQNWSVLEEVVNVYSKRSPVLFKGKLLWQHYVRFLTFCLFGDFFSPKCRWPFSSLNKNETSMGHTYGKGLKLDNCCYH